MNSRNLSLNNEIFEVRDFQSEMRKTSGEGISEVFEKTALLCNKGRFLKNPDNT